MSIISGKEKSSRTPGNSIGKVKVDVKEENVVEEKAETSIRAKKLYEVIGRKSIKNKLKILIDAAKSRNDVLEHMLFYGPPGLGKTTFGYAIANEFGSNFIITSGPALTSKAELASIMTNLAEGDVLFIDEIHRLSKILEEFLYPVLEDFKMDISFGKGTVSKLVRLDIPKFTLIGATTQIGLISSPLRDRFGITFKVDFFPLDELTEIILMHGKRLEVEITKDAALEIAKRSRGTARVAIRNLRRARDYAHANSKVCIDFDIVDKAFIEMEIDELGLDLVMRKYLEIIFDNFQGGPVGLGNIAASIYEDTRTIEEVYEPYLIKLGFLKRTSQGRIITDRGREYISKI